MIYTSSTREQVVVYDRKSKRHNWVVLVATDCYKHALNVADAWKERAAGSKGWENYEQVVTEQKPVDGRIKDNLPKNHVFTNAVPGGVLMRLTR